MPIKNKFSEDSKNQSPLNILKKSNREKKIRQNRDKILEHIRPYRVREISDLKKRKIKHIKSRRVKRIGTLIIGVRCKNGVIIGSDRKIFRGGETEYSNKIFEKTIGGKILFAAEGLTGIRDDFFLLLDYEIGKRRGVDTLYEVKTIVEDIIYELTERYSERTKEPYPIGVLMGGLEKLSEGKAILYFIHSEGYGEKITFRCIGHGEDYAYSLAKFLYGPRLAQELSTQDIAKRVAFSISWVSDDVDSMVGGLPDIFIINDNYSTVEKLPEEVIREMEEYAKRTKKDFSNLIFP